MPFAEVQRPSLALGLLRAALARSHARCEVVYANFAFAETLGLVVYQALQASPADHLLGEWCFAHGLLPGAENDDEEEDYLNSALEIRAYGFPPELEERKEMVRWSRARTGRYLDRLADDILARRPRIVGCSSVFQQHCASLALLKRLRERDANVVTLMGGANCEGEMGIETLRAFPWLDCVVSGEADAFFLALCERFLERGRAEDTGPLPVGVETQWTIRRLNAPSPENRSGNEGTTVGARNVMRDLDALPTPQFDEYFATLAASPLSSMVQPGLLAETSRGCWWGERSHCAFCGLNGTGIAYRSKSPARILSELEELSGRYGLRNIQFADNILDMSHIGPVLGELAKAKPRYSLFYETKANFKRAQVSAIAEAGVYWIQPGIESLDDRVLKLLGKGSTTLLNLQVLKWSLEYGIHASWNFLVGVPGEEDAWYAEIARWLPAVFHLNPPSGVTRIRFDRFSPYHSRPEEYGLTLEPSRAYRSVYPLPRESLMRLAYFFEDVGAGGHFHRAIHVGPGVLRLQQQVMTWCTLWSGPQRPLLQVRDTGSGLTVSDTRPDAARSHDRLGPKAAAVYRLCDSARTPASVAEKLPGHEQATDELIARRLLLPLNGKLLSLGVSLG